MYNHETTSQGLETAIDIGVGGTAERARALQHRFDGLQEPCQIRRENLLESLRHFQWIGEVDEQLLTWINDKIPQLESRDYGSSLHAAQSLNKRHAIVEQEISSRQPIAQALIARGKQMSSGGEEIKSRMDQLVGGMEILKSLAAERSLRLRQSLASQEYYAEEQEAEHWLQERLPLASNQDVGSSQSAAEAHLHRLGALEQEVEKFAEQVDKLLLVCHQMVSDEHFDAGQLTARQTKLEGLYGELRHECQRRRAQLVDASRYHNFVHQADDLIGWLRTSKQLAEKEDYGADLDDCCQLIEQFQQVVKELSATGERVSAMTRLQEELLRECHPNAGSIRAKGSDLQHL